MNIVEQLKYSGMIAQISSEDDLLQHHRDVRDTALSLLVNDRDVTETDRYDKSARTSFFF